MSGDVYEESLKLHEEHKGKLEVCLKTPLKTRWDLSLAYTPGVAQPCREIEKNKDLVYKYTIKSNTVAVVSDGSAVLGLGDIGGYAAIPVMEGKAALFKEFAGIDAFPICVPDRNSDIVKVVKEIAPVFGGINLEDIAAPRCFKIEEELQDIGIPVMHDDQHGTAVIVLAALINACKVSNKRLEDLTVAICGAGAAGFAVTKILKCIGVDKDICTPVKEIFICDSKGLIYKGREDLSKNKYKHFLAQETNQEGRTGTLADAMKGTDVFIGVSAPDIVTEEMVRSMNKDPIIFAMSNPTPEIMPDKAKNAGAAVIGTGRSDFPNQINNVLAFPGIFRGALDAHATRINEEMKVAAAHALADYVKNPTKDQFIADVLDKGVTKAVAEAVKKTAIESGCVREL